LKSLADLQVVAVIDGIQLHMDSEQNISIDRDLDSLQVQSETPDLDEWLSHHVLPVFPRNTDVKAMHSAF
jgi:hypothetical protein